MAKDLGYTDADFSEAFTADPVKTLQILAEEHAARQSAEPQGQQPQGTDLSKQIQDAIDAKLGPVQAFQNRQATDVAMQKYETTVSDLCKADPILKDAPDEIVSIVKDYLGEYFSTQPAILQAMKQSHDFSAVPEALKFVVGRLHSGFKAWLAKSGGAPPPAASAAARPNGKFTLDQIIDDPGVLGDNYK
jgi:hypothetical protein